MESFPDSNQYPKIESDVKKVKMTGNYIGMLNLRNMEMDKEE
jgi:hypothetical protein